MKSVLVLILAIVLLAAGDASAAYSRNSQVTNESLISTTVVINEVYGGAGCGTVGCSTFKNDFIELKNISTGLVNISGYSVQYAAASPGTTWTVTPVGPNVVLRPGDTFLIAQAFNNNGVTVLPTPNATGTTAMSATGGKVALVSTTTALSGACPFPNANIIDFVGYGTTANCNDGGTNNTATNAPAPSTTNSVQRNALLGTDTDVNSADFTAAAPTPLAAAQPTASGASVSGRIVTSNGRGISKVVVTLTDSAGNARIFITNGFGYYSFEELETGATYTISVSGKQYQFNPATRVVSLSENIENFDFTAEP